MSLVTVTRGSAADEPALAGALESGAILLFPDGPIRFAADDLDVLRQQNPVHSRFHKNIAYRPDSGRLGGVGGIPRSDREPVRRALANFSREAVRVVGGVLPRYARSWRVGYTSFRPFEEAGRPLRTTSRNDLMHFDAFPSRPTNGDRILRFFVTSTRASPGSGSPAAPSSVWPNATPSLPAFWRPPHDRAMKTASVYSPGSSAEGGRSALPTTSSCFASTTT
jgi:hypothetical protein